MDVKEEVSTFARMNVFFGKLGYRWKGVDFSHSEYCWSIVYLQIDQTSVDGISGLTWLVAGWGLCMIKPVLVVSFSHHYFS